MKLAMDFLPLRVLRVGDLSWAEVLFAFAQKATPAGRFGHYQTVWQDNERSKEMDIIGRRYNLATGFEGMSCFGLPKVLHSLFRVDVPVSNVDMASSHFQSMKELIADLGLELSDFPNVEAIATDRKKYTASLAMPGFSEDDLKTLVISIAYQCKFDRNWPTPLKHLHREVEKLVHLHAQKHPELVQVARGWAKKRPAVTAFSYKLCHLERLDLDRMMAAAGPAVMCPEFDGLVLFTHPDGEGLGEAVRAVQQASSRPLAVKSYPNDFQAWLKTAAQKYPEFNWQVKSQLPWVRVRESVEAMNYFKDSADEKKAPKLPHTDCALLVSATLEGTVLVTDGHALACCPQTRKWEKVSKQEGLHKVVKAAMLGMFKSGSVRRMVKHGELAMVRSGFAVHWAKDHGVITTVRQEVASDLYSANSPECDTRRNLLAFCNGKVLDTNTGRVMDTQPGHLISRIVPWALEELDSQVLDEFRKVAAEVQEWWKTAARPDLQEIKEFAEEGDAEPIVVWAGNPELLKKMLKVVKSDDYLNIRLTLCGGDLDLLLYKEQWFARILTSMPHFCELLYSYGPGGSGKDVDALFVQEFFGPELIGTIASSDVVLLHGQHERGVDGSTPTMAALNKTRVALVAEVPQGLFAWHRLKHYVEQQGIRAHSRGHGANPRAESPTFAILLWSNHAPDFGNTPLEGAARRTAVIRMDSRYGKVASEEDGEFVDDNQLKYRIQAGQYRLQQLWYAMAWVPALKSYGTSIPKPRCVVENCADIVPNPVKEWGLKKLEECRPPICVSSAFVCFWLDTESLHPEACRRHDHHGSQGSGCKPPELWCEEPGSGHCPALGRLLLGCAGLRGKEASSQVQAHEWGIASLREDEGAG